MYTYMYIHMHIHIYRMPRGRPGGHRTCVWDSEAAASEARTGPGAQTSEAPGCFEIPECARQIATEKVDIVLYSKAWGSMIEHGLVWFVYSRVWYKPLDGASKGFCGGLFKTGGDPVLGSLYTGSGFLGV